MRSNGFDPDVPAAVETALNISTNPPPLSKSTARDLRQLLWSSIDNLSSRDLDQVEYVEPLPNDTIKVLVGIADVDAFVAHDSAIDAYAFVNTTSVYTGVATFPMLPEELSTDKTSLLEGQDRLAIVIEFHVAADGSAKTQDVYPALVRNYSKMSYEVIGEWLDNNTAAPKEVARIPKLEEQVRLQFVAANRLREVRRQQGALQLETIQATPVMDSSGNITDPRWTNETDARSIESFMVAAMGRWQSSWSNATSFLRRVVTTPANWPRIVEIAEGYMTRYRLNLMCERCLIFRSASTSGS